MESTHLPESLRRQLLTYLAASSGERARLMGELSVRNPAVADLLIDLEANDERRTLLEIALLGSLDA